MQPSVKSEGNAIVGASPQHGGKLGTVSGVYIPVCLNILSILLFLRFGVILGHVGFVGIIGLLVVAYCIDFLTLFSLSAIASNGEVKGGGAYYLISRSLGPEFGGSVGILFYIASVLNSAMNIVGLIDCIRLNIGTIFPSGYWINYAFQTVALVFCTSACFLSSATFSMASNCLLAVLSVSVVSIPISAVLKAPFHDKELGIHFTGLSLDTLAENFLPHTTGLSYEGIKSFRAAFGILFPATAGILAGASMSGDLRNPSKAIPNGTLWATLTTFIVYLVVILSMAASTTHASFLNNENIIPLTNLSQTIIFAGECCVTAFSALIGIKTSAGMFRAVAKDRLLPGLYVFEKGVGKQSYPIASLALTYVIAQIALLADLNQIATFISMGFQMTFFVMNLACFLLKIGSAPNFRPSFKFFSWQTALLGSLLSSAAMFFIEETYAALAICVLVLLFLLIHYLCPPKTWGDVSQNLIYHQVRKYLLRLRPEHIKFWRPHIILLINDPRRQTRLIQFCNSMKKGSLYILGHVIVTDDFNTGIAEARLQQQAWTNYISEFSRIKAFVQLTMSPSITWGVRNLILSAGLGGMRPNIAILGFYNMQDLRMSDRGAKIPDVPSSPALRMSRPPPKSRGKAPNRRRGDTSARLLEGQLPTDVIRTEGMLKPTEYMTILEDLALRHRMNVAVGYQFDKLETPRSDGFNTKKYVDLWPIQMSAEVTSEGKNVLTTNFDTYTLILQLGHILSSVQNWHRVYQLRVMVFVEYESEVDDEATRVRALLEKLRIDATVKVFWLASGELNSYESIINGRCNDMDWEIIVNEALRDEDWWDDLQAFRTRPNDLSSSQEIASMAHIFDSTSGRSGLHNPHGDIPERRRSSAVDVGDMSKRAPISSLVKLGVNVGMHTHHLNDNVLGDDGYRDESDSVTDTASEDEETPTGENNLFGTSSWIDSEDNVRQPLLGNPDARNAPGEGALPTIRPSKMAGSTRRKKQNDGNAANYGTILDGKEAFPSLPALEISDTTRKAVRRSRSSSPVKADKSAPVSGTATPIRPSMSRQSSAMRFSSRPVPETTITAEGEGSKIGFAEQPSASMYVARYEEDHSKEPSRKEQDSRSISFAGQPEYYTPAHSRSSSHYQKQSMQSSLNHSKSSSVSGHGDLSLDISRLSDSQQTTQVQYPDEASESAQSLSLSFNDLPSRAQHLIINELMRQHSTDTAVLFTTLPIPAEGTCLSETDTIQYLSDIEVLCNELPPALMVLSNNMTVTVSL